MTAGAYKLQHFPVKHSASNICMDLSYKAGPQQNKGSLWSSTLMSMRKPIPRDKKTHLGHRFYIPLDYTTGVMPFSFLNLIILKSYHSTCWSMFFSYNPQIVVDDLVFIGKNSNDVTLITSQCTEHTDRNFAKYQ